MVLRVQLLQALAQHRFKRIFPSLLNLDVLPQTRQCIKLMPCDPCAQSLAAFEAFLQALQSAKPRFDPDNLLFQHLHFVRKLAFHFLGIQQEAFGLHERFLFAFQISSAGLYLPSQAGQCFDFRLPITWMRVSWSQ